jgi:hypothetical protein
LSGYGIVIENARLGYVSRINKLFDFWCGLPFYTSLLLIVFAILKKCGVYDKLNVKICLVRNSWRGGVQWTGIMDFLFFGFALMYVFSYIRPGFKRMLDVPCKICAGDYV